MTTIDTATATAAERDLALEVDELDLPTGLAPLRHVQCSA